jgi:uncharacterized DUF497 family protein
MIHFEWDESKNRQNRRKHGLSFETAAQVFFDPFAITESDRDVEGEVRLWTIGRIHNLLIVVVVHVTLVADDDQIIRIISARKATPLERRVYEEENE